MTSSQTHWPGRGQKYFNISCPTARVTYNFHSSCKHIHLSFKSLCNKEYKGVICNMTSSRYSFQSTCPTGRVLGKYYSSFLDFTRNYERTSGIFVPFQVLYLFEPAHKILVLIAYANSKGSDKVRKTARIRNQYSQVPHLSQDTKWENNKITIIITNKSQEVSPFPAGDHKAAMNRLESMTYTRHK